MHSREVLQLLGRVRRWGWLGLMAGLLLACQIALGPEGVQVFTAATATPARTPSPRAQTPRAEPTQAVPFPFGAAAPVVPPTPVPTRPGPATPPTAIRPTPTTGVVPVTGSIMAEIWDFPSGKYAKAQQGVYYAVGGDVYELNLYERPFVEQTQAVFYPDLDIRYARLVRVGDWFFLALRLHGLQAGSTAPRGDYGVELDVDLDGRGEYLVWAQGPIAATWSPQHVRVLVDNRPDVEGPRACTSDAPLRGDGYEQVRYVADATTGLAWQTWGWEREGSSTYPTVYLAFHARLLDGHGQRMLWQAWADGGLKQPGQMTYHDRYTRAQAGSPYARDPNFPIRAIARVDNTCRAAFGFQPTGLEPCLCEATRTELLCPAPPDAQPAPGCVPDGPGTWSCPYASSTGGGMPQVTAADARFFCTWDPELCQWSCRSERLCLPPSPEDARARVTPVLPDGAASACYNVLGELVCTDGTTPSSGAGPAGLDVPRLPFDQPPGPGNLSVPGLGGWVLGQGEKQRVCVWDPNLCRWQCRETQCVLPEPGPNCEPLGDGRYRCTSGGELELTTLCQADTRTCRWDCQPEQTCPAPTEAPSSACQPLGEGAWACSSEIGAWVCSWDAQQCDWRCEDDTCRIPNQDCALDERTEHWICPGRGEFEQCTWSEDKCRWRCWNPIRPKPSEEPGDGSGEQPRTCQSETYCSLDGEIWYCNDGNAYSRCEYDGCTWHCE
ncbi:MAG: hypothetical protein GXO36_00255 [Chloroflexi bacterium]|nr:hypothetical protein [Chloroflexota bacterium]